MQHLYFILAGFLGGILAGLGMGGGTLTIPILVLGLGVGQLTAQLVNLVAFLPTGTVALGFHIKNNLVDTNNLAYIIIPSIIFAVISSIFAMQINMDILKKIYGGFLILVASCSLIAKVLLRK